MPFTRSVDAVVGVICFAVGSVCLRGRYNLKKDEIKSKFAFCDGPSTDRHYDYTVCIGCISLKLLQVMYMTF